MKLNKPILLALLAINPITKALYAEDAPAADKVAKVIIIKGQAKAKLLNAQVVDLKKDDWLPEGAIIQTTDKSFVKLVFIDKSTVSVGPQSKMVISSFPKEGAGVLSVIKGQIRSQVVKELDSNGEAKLFVKTKSAAMGVRGTDFQVMFNPENNVTSLVTFEGNVAFAKMDPATSSSIPTINQPAAATNGGSAATGTSASAPASTNVALESVISSEKAVHVTAGQFSGANPGAVMATIPTKISPAQFETMKGNASLGAEAPAAAKVEAPTAPKYVSVVAPGLPPALAANTESSITKVVATNLGGEDNLKKAVAVVTGETKKADGPATGEAKRDVASTGKEAPKDTAPVVAANTTAKSSSPEGFVNKSTGEYQPPAGGYVDFGTGLYIPPPPGSTFDANTGVYVPPPQFGGFNPVSGNYAPPTGLVLTPNGEFVAAPKERAPASDGKPAAGAATDAGKPAAGVAGAATTAALVPPPINASGDLSKVYNPAAFATFVAGAPNSANQFGMPPIYAGANVPGAPGSTVPGGYVPPAYDSERLDNLRNNVYNQINQQNQIIQSTRIKINIIVQ